MRNRLWALSLLVGTQFTLGGGIGLAGPNPKLGAIYTLIGLVLLLYCWKPMVNWFKTGKAASGKE